MSPSRRAVAGAIILLFALGACTEQPTTPRSAEDSSSPGAALTADPQGIPTRSEERPGTFIDMSDAELWRHLQFSDRTAAIGLKASGAVRGVFQGEILIDRARWDQATLAMRGHPGVSVLSVDPLLPIIEVRIQSAAVLGALRRHPMVDYLEPVRAPDGLVPWASTGGCGWPGAWGGDWQTTPSGDGYSVRFTAMRIPDAWGVIHNGKRVSGEGITIGSIDTGIALSQSELRGGFAGGSVPSRWAQHLHISGFGSSDDACGHGTRMAGVIVAPDDGRGVIGVAWGANLVNVRHANGVANVSSSDARASVRAAGNANSRVVSMAWQSMNWFWQVSDEIKWWHYNRQVLFLAAAGTSGCGDLIPDNNVVFPAEMAEVVAVTGIAHPNGGVPCGVHYGKQVELTGYLDVPTTGRDAGFVTSIGGSSNATAIVAGIAALAWQANPGFTRDQLRARLQQSGAFHPNRSSTQGFGLVNAYKAVTGVAAPAVGTLQE
jgi:hypothetical protein